MATKSVTWQDKMEDFFVKLPALPKPWREVIVNITPWLALVFGILGVVVGLAGLGILSVLAPFMVVGGGVSSASGSLLGMAAAVVAAVLMLMAFPGTKNRKKQGWNMLFWSEVVSLLSSLLSFAVVSGLVGAFIGFYLLYQIKSYYK